MDPLAVDERAVARQPRVVERVLVRRALDLRVQARDLAVPVDAQVRRRVAADHESLAVAQRDDPQRTARVADLQERDALALLEDHGLQLDGARRTRRPSRSSR